MPSNPLAPLLIPRRSRGERVTIVIVLAMIATCAATLLERDRVRAWWWARALVRAESLPERSYYLTMLSALRSSAVPAAIGLLHDPRAEIRSLGVAILGHGASSQARAALIEALHDPDQEVRDDASHALAFGFGRAAVDDLATRIASERGEPALAMCVAIGRSDEPAATDALIEIARRHPDADVRAQAVERLGYRRSSAVETVLRALCEEQTPITQPLYDERMIERALGYAQAHGPGSRAASSAASTAFVRTLGDVAKVALRRLNTPPTTLPASMPGLPIDD